MKANEAPERIYLDEDESWHLTNPNGDSIEYVRTDAFIEKAINWLINNTDITHTGTKNFRKAMKGK